MAIEKRIIEIVSNEGESKKFLLSQRSRVNYTKNAFGEKILIETDYDTDDSEVMAVYDFLIENGVTSCAKVIAHLDANQFSMPVDGETIFSYDIRERPVYNTSSLGDGIIDDMALNSLLEIFTARKKI